MSVVDSLLAQLLRTPHVLVLEDVDKHVQQELRSSYEVSIDAVSDERSAADLLRSKTYDLIILNAFAVREPFTIARALVTRNSSVPVVIVCRDAADLSSLVPLFETVTLADYPVKKVTLDRLMRIFRIKAKACDFDYTESSPCKTITAQA